MCSIFSFRCAFSASFTHSCMAQSVLARICCVEIYAPFSPSGGLVCQLHPQLRFKEHVGNLMPCNAPSSRQIPASWKNSCVMQLES